jgi:hypothetical protein
MEQRAVEILRNDPQMRMEFLKLRGGSHRAHPIRVRLDSLMTAQRGVQDKHTRATPDGGTGPCKRGRTRLQTPPRTGG